MENNRKFVLPIVLVIFGLSWLLSELDLFVVKEFFWSILLLFIGITILASKGIVKGSFVSGIFFIIWSGLSMLIDMESISANLLLPILLVSLGALLMISRSSLIPEGKYKKKDSH